MGTYINKKHSKLDVTRF